MTRCRGGGLEPGQRARVGVGRGDARAGFGGELQGGRAGAAADLEDRAGTGGQQRQRAAAGLGRARPPEVEARENRAEIGHAGLVGVHVARQEGDLRGLGVGEALPREPGAVQVGGHALDLVVPVAQAAAARKPRDEVAGAGFGGDLGLERVEPRGKQAGVALPVEAGAAFGKAQARGLKPSQHGKALAVALGVDPVAIGLPPPAQKADALVMEQRRTRQADSPREVGDEKGGRVGRGHGPVRKV